MPNPMTLEDWLQVFGSIDGLSANIATFNSLFVVAITMLFALVVVVMAFWKKNIMLNALAGIICVIISALWLQDTEMPYMLALGSSMLFLGLATMANPIINMVSRR